LTIERASQGDLRPEIEKIGARLRKPLNAVLEALAGRSPRPTQVARAIGLDKSLASRFVRATTTSSDLELMHVVPSPEGLRILAELAGSKVEPRVIGELLAATDAFQQLIDGTPGGRSEIDAQISEGSDIARERSEQVARQAAFKSMSYLLGHFCETLSTTLFLVPAANGRMVDGIEVHRRIGLRRMRPSTPLALLSIFNSGAAGRPADAVAFETIDGGMGPNQPTDYLLPEFSSRPLPQMEVLTEGAISTLVLAGDPSVHAPTHLASAFRVRNGWPVVPESALVALRGYLLHMPCRRLVRDVFVAESLFPNAVPLVSFALPGQRGSDPPPGQDGGRHYSSVGLHAPIEQLPPGPRAWSLPGTSDHSAVLQNVLERSRDQSTRFRGWRCAMTYPVPLIEMFWWLRDEESSPSP
jgi:hypothetical protein